jgi:biopolymer transport protein ExbD
VADADVTPMLNLMVILIPVLLTSSEFVKVGTIELKLPEATRSPEAAVAEAAWPRTRSSSSAWSSPPRVLTCFSYFKAEDKERPVVTGEKQPDIPLVNGQYDFTALGEKLADIKKKALFEVIRSLYANVPSQATLGQLYKTYIAKDFSDSKIFSDHESVKIVAEDKIKYETVVSVMDAARGYKTPEGNITMFPNVAIAGGIIQ